jgi:hypothetical protein
MINMINMINIHALHNLLVDKNASCNNMDDYLSELPVTIYGDNENVYITKDTEIYRSTDDVNFTTMTLSGTVDSPFGNVTKGPDGRFYCIDNSAIWTKEADSDTFIRRSDWPSFVKSRTAKTWISADHNSNVIIYSDNEWYGADLNRLVAADATTGAIIHTFIIEDIGSINAYPRPAKIQTDRTWLIGCPGSSGYSVVKYVEGVGFTRVLLEFSTNNVNIAIDTDSESDSIVLVGSKSSVGFFRYSMDFGTTWSPETIFDVSDVMAVCSLIPQSAFMMLVGQYLYMRNELAL